MKTLALSACVAVAATVSAVELKDPTQVTADWNQAVADSREPILSTGPLGLTAAGTGSVTSFKSTGAAPLHRRRFKDDGIHVPPGWQIDPKIQRGAPDETPPPGAKPWFYRGQRFWIIPIAAEETR